AGLDAASEKLVFEALDKLMQNRTVIVIAHRLSTIRRADNIFVIQDGSIVESGNHEKLMQKDGLYAELHNLQFGAEESVDVRSCSVRSWIQSLVNWAIIASTALA